MLAGYIAVLRAHRKHRCYGEVGKAVLLADFFDKGFYSKKNKEYLARVVEHLIMPKKGKRNAAEKEEETAKSFKLWRNRHSAVESNVNELEHCGLDRCPDKGYENFQRYIAMGVTAYNLRRIGKQLLTQDAATKLKKSA